MLVNLVVQILWISYAPITADAARFYGGFRTGRRLHGDGLHDRLRPPRDSGRRADRPLGASTKAWASAPFSSLSSPWSAACPAEATWGRWIGSVGIAVAQPFFLNAWTGRCPPPRTSAPRPSISPRFPTSWIAGAWATNAHGSRRRCRLREPNSTAPSPRSHRL